MSSWQAQLSSNSERLAHIFKTGDFSDVTFIVGVPPDQNEFKLHKNILCMCSDVFERMFYGSLQEKSEVTISDIQPAIFEKAMKYVYEGSFIYETMEVAIQLYYTADKYNIVKLRELCIDHITRHLSVENISLLYEHNMSYILEDLGIKSKCDKMLSEKTLDVLKSNNFVECPLQMVKYLLQLDELNIENEETLFNFVLKWAKEKKTRECSQEELREIMEPFLPHIRFLSMTVKGFLSGPGSSDVLTDSEISSISTNLVASHHRELPSWCSRQKYREGPNSIYSSFKSSLIGNHICNFPNEYVDFVECFIEMRWGKMNFRGVSLYVTISNPDLIKANNFNLYVIDGIKKYKLRQFKCRYDLISSNLKIILPNSFSVRNYKFSISLKSNIGCVFNQCAVDFCQKYACTEFYYCNYYGYLTPHFSEIIYD